MISSKKKKKTNENQEAVCSGLISAAGFYIVLSSGLGIEQLGQGEPWDRMEYIELERTLE